MDSRTPAVAILAVFLALAVFAPTAASQPADGDSDNLTVGEQLSVAVNAQDSEVRETVENRAFERKFEREGAEAVEERAESLRKRVRDAEERRAELERRLEEGDISERRYRARVAVLSVEAESVNRSVEGVAERAEGLEDGGAQGVNIEKVRELRRNASRLAKFKTSETTRGIAGSAPDNASTSVSEDEGRGDSKEEADERRGTPEESEPPEPAGPRTPGEGDEGGGEGSEMEDDEGREGAERGGRPVEDGQPGAPGRPSTDGNGQESPAPPVSGASETGSGAEEGTVSPPSGIAVSAGQERETEDNGPDVRGSQDDTPKAGRDEPGTRGNDSGNQGGIDVDSSVGQPGVDGTPEPEDRSSGGPAETSGGKSPQEGAGSVSDTDGGEGDGGQSADTGGRAETGDSGGTGGGGVGGPSTGTGETAEADPSSEGSVGGDVGREIDDADENGGPPGNAEQTNTGPPGGDTSNPNRR